MNLVLCCGNPLRGDDAVAWAIADCLGGASGAAVETCHAFGPELAPAIAAATTVIFVDARADDAPGRVRCDRIEPADTAATPRHGESPESLLALARTLYAAAPDAYLVTIGARQFDFGAELSPQALESVPRALALIRSLLRKRSRP